MAISDESLDELMRLSDACPTQRWTSMWESRDHEAGDSFILTEGSKGRGPDLYFSEDGARITAEMQDLIAAARTYLPLLVAELREHRAQALRQSQRKRHPREE